VNRTRSWIFYAALLVLFWGVWGALSSLPINLYGYPDEMIYVIWAFTMIIPAVFALRGQKFDRRPKAAMYGLLIGLTGAGGQLLLFNALSTGPAYLIFPIISVSPAITVLMAVIFLRERLRKVAIIGLFAALAAIVLFSVAGSSGEATAGPWLLIAIFVSIAWGVQAFFMRKAISGLALVPFAILAMGGLPLDVPWQAPALTAVTQLLNAIGALFLVMALSRGKASIVAPTTNALAPVLTIIVSLVIYQTLPSPFGAVAIVLALVGSTLMVYSDEKRGEAVPEALLTEEAAREATVAPR
jgi:uncharacterized membrane protein